MAMKKVLIYLLGIIVLIVALDFICGKAFNAYVRTHRLPGDCLSIDYTLKDMKEDVVIIGNSQVLNALMPSVLSDTLSMTVYNSGSNGQTLPFFHTMQQGILKRYTPKAVILGVNETVFTTDGIGDRYNILAPYYGLGYPMLDSCLSSQSKVDKLMMNSTFYRFNSIWWRILLYHLVDKRHQSDGFIAKPDPPFPPKLTVLKEEYPLQKERFSEFNKMLDEFRKRGVKVAVVMTPVYFDNQTGRTLVNRLKKLVVRYDNAIFIDDATDSLFLAHPDYFYDNDHLNARGALEYSKLKAVQLKNFLKTDNSK